MVAPQWFWGVGLGWVCRDCTDGCTPVVLRGGVRMSMSGIVQMVAPQWFWGVGLGWVCRGLYRWLHPSGFDGWVVVCQDIHVFIMPAYRRWVKGDYEEDCVDGYCALNLPNYCINRTLEMTPDAQTNAGKHVISNAAFVHSQRFTNDPVLWLTQMTLCVMKLHVC